MRLSSIVVLILGASSSALADDADHPVDPHDPAGELRPISFDDVMSLAAQAPSVVSARRAAAAQRGIDESISGLGNPEIYVSPGVRTAGPKGGAAEISVIQPIPLGRLGAARRAAGEAEAEALDRQAEAVALGIRLEAASAFCSLWGASRSREDVAEDAALAQELLTKLEKGAAAGQLPASDVAEAHIFLAESRLLLVALEGEIHDLGLDLSSRLELAAPGVLIAGGDLPTFDLRPAVVREALASIERAPDVALLSMQAAAASARSRELAAEARPPLGIGARFTQDGPGDRAWYAVLSWSPPIFDRGQRERGKAAAEVRSLEGGREKAISQARAALLGMKHEVEHTAGALEVLDAELLPAAKEAVRLREIALAYGSGTVFELVNAKRTLVQAKARRIRAKADAAAAQARLSLMLRAVGAMVADDRGSVE